MENPTDKGKAYISDLGITRTMNANARLDRFCFLEEQHRVRDCVFNEMLVELKPAVQDREETFTLDRAETEDIPREDVVR